MWGIKILDMRTSIVFGTETEDTMNHPDLNAAAHSHSMYGKTFSTMGRLLEPITQDSCAFYENHVLFDDFTGVVLDTSEGDRIAEALGDKKAAILKNHGLLTTGTTVDEAAWDFYLWIGAASLN